MSKIINAIQTKEEVIHGSGVSIQEIQCAEQTLGVRFNEEYKEYLLTYGLVIFDGRELTGIGKVKRTNVVDVTMELWSKTDKVPHSMYVIEEANIDGLIILQDEIGTIYQLIFGNEPCKLCSSFSTYLESY